MRALLLLHFCLPLVSAAQSIPVNGVLTLHNSAYRTGRTIHVQGAAVRAERSKPSISDANGRFALEIVGSEAGTTVRISVDHDRWVVLDPYAVENVVLGASVPLVIRMADPKELAAERIKYHGIAEAAIEARYKERMQRLRDSTMELRTRLNEVLQEFGGDSVDLAGAIAELVDQRQQALAGLDDLTERFVMADLDAASERFRGAYEAFTSGDVEMALRALDPDELDRERAIAMEKGEEGEEKITEANKAISDIRQCYRLKADVLLMSMRPREALDAMRAELVIVEDNPDVFLDIERVRTTLKLADLERVNGLTASVYARVQKLLELPWLNGPAARSERMDALMVLGRTQYNDRDLDAVMHTAKEIIRSARSMDGQAWKTAGQAHTLIGGALVVRHELEPAFAHLDTARTYLERSGSEVGHALADALQLMATVRIYQYRFADAAELLQRCIRMEEARPHPDHLRLAIYLGDLSFVYSRNGPLPMALDLQTRSLELSRRLYGLDHPSVKSVEATLANTYSALDMSDSALVVMDRCVAGYERWYGGPSYELAMYIENRADLHADLDMPIEALAGARRGIGLIDRHYRFERVGRAACMVTIAKAYRILGVRDSAFIWVESAMDTLREIHGTGSHPNLIFAMQAKSDLLLDRGEVRPALDLLRKEAQMRTMIFGRDHWKLMPVVLKLAEAHRLAGWSDSTAHYLEWARGLAYDVSVMDSKRARLYEQWALHHEWIGETALALLYSDSAMAMSDKCPPGPIRTRSMRTSRTIHARMLLHRLEPVEAVRQLNAMAAMPPCAQCTPGRDEIRYRSLLGGALLLSGRTDTARLVIEEAVRESGDADALWYEYLLSENEREPDENVDALLRCWGIRRRDINSSPLQKRSTWEALAARAAEVGRTDELKGLEPEELPR